MYTIQTYTVSNSNMFMYVHFVCVYLCLRLLFLCLKMYMIWFLCAKTCTVCVFLSVNGRKCFLSALREYRATWLWVVVVGSLTASVVYSCTELFRRTGLDYSTESMGIDQDPHIQLPANPCAMPGGLWKTQIGWTSIFKFSERTQTFVSFSDPMV